MTTWLIDKSALVRLAASPDVAEWAARIERGLVRITTVTRLEAGYSAQPMERLTIQQAAVTGDHADQARDDTSQATACECADSPHSARVMGCTTS